METKKAGRASTDILETLRGYRCQPNKLSNTMDGETKIFNDKVKFQQYLSKNTNLYKILDIIIS